MDTCPLILGGSFQTTTCCLTVTNPYTTSPCAVVSLAGPAEIEKALVFAEEGARKMAALPAHARAAILFRLADLIQENAEELTSIIVQEGGKVRKYAAAEVSRAAGTIRISAEESVRLCGSMIPMEGYPAGEGRLAFSLLVPVGIVLAITPFNLPLNQICHKAGPAIAAGNSCIIKPSSATPRTALKFGELLLKAGLPPEAISVLPCRPEYAEILVRDPRIGALSFTGSSEVGWHLRQITRAGKVTLELGGNAAVIVDDDRDLETAASRIVEGAFSHAGQVCISVQRVFVQRSIADALTTEIVNRCNALKPGDPRDPATDIGPMIHPDKTKQALQRISDAKASGARVVFGGVISQGILVPTVLLGTTPGMEVNCEEVFAPILTITPYDRFDEAVAMVNQSRYGLQAGVFTSDIRKALSAAATITCGAVIIGDIPTFRIDSMPYGGVKASGAGREGPYYAIREMTEERLVVIRR